MSDSGQKRGRGRPKKATSTGEVNKGGRPPKTEIPANVREALINAYREGVGVDTAASAAGIDRTTWWRWRKAAEEGREPYVSLVVELLQERSKAVVEVVRLLRTTDDKYWQRYAWWLERCARDDFGREYAPGQDMGWFGEGGQESKQSKIRSAVDQLISAYVKRATDTGDADTESAE